MHNDFILEGKERKLAQFPEKFTAEELMKKAQECYPSLRSHTGYSAKNKYK